MALILPRAAAGQRLADRRVMVRALVRRSVQPVGPEVDGRWSEAPHRARARAARRTTGSRCSEMPLARAAAAEERPAVVVGVRRRGHPSEADEVVLLVEVRVVHRDVGRVRRGLVDGREPAVAEVRPGPGAVRLVPLGAVVLGAADREVRVGRVHGERLELRRGELRCCSGSSRSRRRRCSCRCRRRCRRTRSTGCWARTRWRGSRRAARRPTSGKLVTVGGAHEDVRAAGSSRRSRRAASCSRRSGRWPAPCRRSTGRRRNRWRP